MDRKKVAQNRRPACQASPGTGKGGKSVPSLEEWVQELSKTEKPEEVRSKISKLQVKPGKNVYNDPKRVLPGAIFYYKNHRYVKTGQRSGGAMLHAYGYGKKDFPKGQCKVRPKTGLVFV